MGPLPNGEYKLHVRTALTATRGDRRPNGEHRRWFVQYALKLAQGYNLCFYGHGSERATIKAFARSKCATGGHVVVVNGYTPAAGEGHPLGAIGQVSGMIDAPPAGTGVEGQPRTRPRSTNIHAPLPWSAVARSEETWTFPARVGTRRCSTTWRRSCRTISCLPRA